MSRHRYIIRRSPARASRAVGATRIAACSLDWELLFGHREPLRQPLGTTGFSGLIVDADQVSHERGERRLTHERSFTTAAPSSVRLSNSSVDVGQEAMTIENVNGDEIWSRRGSYIGSSAGLTGMFKAALERHGMAATLRLPPSGHPAAGVLSSVRRCSLAR